MLVNRLKNDGYEAIHVQPVYVLMDIIRLKEENKNSISPRRVRVAGISSSVMQRVLSLLGYFYALVTYIFMKFMSRNKMIICDRYFYQFFFDLFGDFSEKVMRIFSKPDITFFLDGDLDLFYSRMDNSFDASVDRDYYTKALNLYRRISQKHGFIKIDANLEREKINDIIFRAIKEKVGAKYNE